MGRKWGEEVVGLFRSDQNYREVGNGIKFVKFFYLFRDK